MQQRDALYDVAVWPSYLVLSGLIHFTYAYVQRHENEKWLEACGLRAIGPSYVGLVIHGPSLSPRRQLAVDPSWMWRFLECAAFASAAPFYLPIRAHGFTDRDEGRDGVRISSLLLHAVTVIIEG